MKAILYVITILGAVVGLFALIAAGDALFALACALVPYCLARSIDHLMQEASTP